MRRQSDTGNKYQKREMICQDLPSIGFKEYAGGSV
jgi:hypothetical protein